MLKRYIFLMVTLLPLIGLCSQIQQKKVFEKPVFGLVFNIDYNFYSLETINEYLINSGFMQLPYNHQFAQSMSFGFIVKNDEISPLSLELLINKLLWYSKNSSGFNSSGISLDFLYNIANNKKWEISPLAGIGLKNNALTIINENAESSVSSVNLEETFYRKKNCDLKLGFRLNYNLSIYNINMKMGITPFFNFDFGNKEWYNYSGTKILSIPEFSRSGFGFSFGVISIL